MLRQDIVIFNLYDGCGLDGPGIYHPYVSQIYVPEGVQWPNAEIERFLSPALAAYGHSGVSYENKDWTPISALD